MASFLDQVNNQAKEEVKDKNEAVPKGIVSTEHESEVDKNFFVKKVMSIILLILVSAVVVAGAWYAIYIMRMVTVIDFKDRSAAEIRKWASECHLVLDEKSVYDDKTSEDIIISQSINAGQKVSPKSVVTVTVSKGANPDEGVKVPDLLSMTASDARKWIDDNKLVATKVVEENNEATKGKIIRYEFSSVAINEKNFKRNSGLTIYVSKGPEASKVTAKNGILVPNFSEYSQEEASSVSGNLSVCVKTVYSMYKGYGKLVSQSVAPGTYVLSNDNSVTLIYSLGQPYMPNIIGKSESELPELEYNFNHNGVNFSYEKVYVDSAEEKGTIVGSSKYCEYISLNEHIKVQVSKGNLLPTN